MIYDPVKLAFGTEAYIAYMMDWIMAKWSWRLWYSFTPTLNNIILPTMPLFCSYMLLHFFSTHLYMPSKGRVSLKHESHTSFTAFTAITSSLQNGRLIKDLTALDRTQFWCCCVTCQLFLVKNSRVHRHSPLKLEALI